jgi:hypothetical protein
MIEVTQEIVDQARTSEGIQKYQKRPIQIEAYRIKQPFYVKTLEGTMQGKENDFVVVGIRGELYICDQEIFDETYIKV